MSHRRDEYAHRLRLLQRATWARKAIRENRLDPLSALDLVTRPSARILEIEVERKAA